MMKTLNMALVRCAVGFSEEIIAVFQIKKSQIDTENDNSRGFQFSKFLRIFGRIFNRLRGLDCFKGSTRKQCSVVVFEEFIAFFRKKMSQIYTENDNSKVFLFSKILCIFIQIFEGLRQLER